MSHGGKEQQWNRYLIRNTKLACEWLSLKTGLAIFLPFGNMCTLQRFFLKSDFGQYLFTDFSVCDSVINATRDIKVSKGYKDTVGNLQIQGNSHLFKYLNFSDLKSPSTHTHTQSSLRTLDCSVTSIAYISVPLGAGHCRHLSCGTVHWPLTIEVELGLQRYVPSCLWIASHKNKFTFKYNFFISSLLTCT